MEHKLHGVGIVYDQNNIAQRSAFVQGSYYLKKERKEGAIRKKAMST